MTQTTEQVREQAITTSASLSEGNHRRLRLDNIDVIQLCEQ